MSSRFALPSLLLALIATVAHPGCGDREEPAPETPEASPEDLETPRPPLVEAISRPPALEGEALDSLIAQVQESADVADMPREPIVGSPGPIVQHPPSRPVIDNDDLEHFPLRDNLRDQVEDGPLMETQDRLLHREPALIFEKDGTAVINFATLREIPGASVYYGTVVPEDALGLGRHRARSRRLESLSDDGGIFEYIVEINPRRLLRPKYDVRDTLSSGRGVVSWRLEILDSEQGTSQIVDGENAFRCNPCNGEERHYTQLPSLRTGPFADQVGTTEATVSFSTDASTIAMVAYFPEGGATELLRGEEAGTHHEFTITGLSAGTRYRYHPIVVDRNREVHVHRGGTFETAAEDLEHFEFVAMSDSRSGHGAADERYGGTNARVLRGLLQTAMQRDPRFVMFVGDLADGYTTSENSFRYELRSWQRAVAPYHAHLPIYEIMGNHEALIDVWQKGWAADRQEGSTEDIFAEFFVNPGFGPVEEPARINGAPTFEENTYSFDYGNAHFTAVNTNYWYRSHRLIDGHPAGEGGFREGWISDESLAWLEADLSAARERGQKHLFVFTHEPGFPNGGHSRDGMYWHGEIPEVLAQRQRYFQVLGRYQVAAVVNGDEHNYSRLEVDSSLIEGMEHPVVQLISGGAGAPYYAQEMELPWAHRVAAFDPRQHFVRFIIDGDDVRAEAVAIGGEIIDRFELGGDSE